MPKKEQQCVHNMFITLLCDAVVQYYNLPVN